MLTLVLEMKGKDSEQDRIKRAELTRWINAVNEDGRFGTWDWDVAFVPSEVRPILEKHYSSNLSCKTTITCLSCGKTADSRIIINELFGYKIDNGITSPNPFCYECMNARK